MSAIGQAYALDGTIVHDGATCKLSVWDGMPTMRYLSHVHVPPKRRGQRAGSALLTEICWRADCRDMSLVVHIQPADDCPLSHDDLVAWYSRHLFVVLQPAGPKQLMLMVRYPEIIREREAMRG